MKNNRQKKFQPFVLMHGHLFLAASKETEQFIVSSLTGLYDKLTVKAICKFLKFLPVYSHMKRNEIWEGILCSGVGCKKR